jgi:hypothetical protein
MMMAVLRGPENSKKTNGAIIRIRRNYRNWVPRILWRCSFLLLASGGFLLRYGMIGPVGMRRIWKCAELFEKWAEQIGYLSR